MKSHRPPRFLYLLVASIVVAVATTADAAHLAEGFRVGEVDTTSAIVWTRVTLNRTANRGGFQEPEKRVEKVDEYTPSTVSVDERRGAVPGADGQVRLLYSTEESLSDAEDTGWKDVSPGDDFTYKFHLTDLEPGTSYFLKLEARPEPGQPVSATHTGSFETPVPADEWQDVSFSVITGQAYWDLDHPAGFHIYPAMEALDVDFLVPTGDTVYLDSEAPRARTIELARYHWNRMYGLHRVVEFHRHIPGYWEKDDHDTWVDDCWPTKEAKWMNPITFEQGQQIYLEQVPIGDSNYRTFRWGKGLQIWLVEGRDFRSANDEPDGPDKTIWGEEQKEWLQRTLKESDAEFRVLVSPTPIVGPDRLTKADNHANAAFAHEGRWFREWVADQNWDNFYVCCGDRHWQYHSIDPETGLKEFSCGPASDEHAGGTPGPDMAIQPFHLVKGGFLTVAVDKSNGEPRIAFRHHDVFGRTVHEEIFSRR